MAINSYTKSNADLLLLSALWRVPAQVGFYIDAGSGTPEHDSVTNLLYEKGWRGINIEPSPERFARLTETRKRDINIEAVASNTPGEVIFPEIVGEQPDDILDAFANRHSDPQKKPFRSSVVNAVTLTQICERHAPKEIHFLKVGVEGHEAKVLDGMDFARFRPWILVIELTEPDIHPSSHQSWDKRVRDAGYDFVFADELSRYYVAEEHAELTSNLSVSAHEYTAGRLLRLEMHLDEIAAGLRDLGHRFSQLDTRFNDYQKHNETLISAGEFTTQEEIKNILRLLRPYAVKGFCKARFGSSHDGGYINLDDFRGVDTAFSFGIEQNASWDVDVAKRGVTVYQFDHTVDAPITDNPRLIFARKKISPEAGPESESLLSLISQHDKQNTYPNILLKIDIECNEWAVFDATPPEILSRFSQIVGEFHYLQGLSDVHWRRLLARVFKKLSSAYAVVHVHANNYAGFSNVANVIVPNVLEITFANRGIYSFSETDEVFPGPLDISNNPSHPDMHLGTFRF
jgi:FkbM family methyltransferase